MLNEYKFCPVCTEPLESKVVGGAKRKQCTDKECVFVFWNNPTPVLAAITHRRDEVILIQAIGWPKHWYSLVTGFHEAGETAEEGVLREVKEELGLNGTVQSLVGVYSFFEMNQVIIAYDVLVDEGDITLDPNELIDYKIIKTQELKTWPSGTGQAAKDWLAAQGIVNEDIPFRKK